MPAVIVIRRESKSLSLYEGRRLVRRLGVATGITFSFDDPVRYVTEFAATIPNASPSMRLDHLAGRRSEIDVINGAVVTRSRDLGLDAPYNEALCAILRQRESRFG